MAARKRASGSAGPQSILDRKIRLSRLALAWERLWPALALPLFVAGAFAVITLAGFWVALPTWAHRAGLAAAALIFIASFRPLTRFRWPSRDEARTRLDTSGLLEHRPATAFEDTLAVDSGSAGRRLWDAHRKRIADKIAALRVAPPSPRLLERDPFALRAVLLLLFVVAVAYAGPDWRSRLTGAVAPGAVAAIEPVRLDAWISPPAYTGRPPVFLADGAQPLRTLKPADGPVETPAGSTLVLRFHGAEKSTATITPVDGSPAQSLAYGTEPEAEEIEVELTGDVVLEVERGSELEPLSWMIVSAADQAPLINLAEDVSTTRDQALKLVYSVKDDYGVIGAGAQFALTEREQEEGEEPELPWLPDPEEEDAKEAESAPAPDLEVAPPDFALVLPGVRVRDAVNSMFRDLTAHPWAGLEVELTLTARDEAGQEGTSEPVSFRLPERRFRNPLAKAVIEQRRNLVRKPQTFPKVARSLAALTIAPDRYIKDYSIYLGLRVAHYRTAEISDSESLGSVVDFLWDIALRIEDGDLSLAERELRAAQEALARALAEGATDEEIERLMDELRAALGRFLQALRDQAQRQAESGQQQQLQDGEEVESRDLSQMMDMIEQLAKSGARDAAQQLLSQLQNLLENLEGAATAQMSPEQSMMSEMLDELGRMIQEQQRLMDETFRQDQQGQNGQQGQQQGSRQQPGQQGGAPGQRGQQGQGRGSQPGDGQSLAQRQEALRNALEALRERLGQAGQGAPSPLDRAGESMGEAGEDLRQGQPGMALGPQREALDQLRQGAQSMAEQLAEGMNPGPGQGEPGQIGANGPTDPLGRPLRNTGPEFGLSVKVPDEIDAELARRLRDELRRRLGDRLRPEMELDYIERLLDRF